MMPVAALWLQFLTCVCLIGVSGPVLCRSGDVIAEKTGLSATWIGLLLLASATSLPELIIGVSSVTIANQPDIAVGDALGSCVFNLVILVPLDFLQRGENVYRRARQGHVLAGAFGIVLIGFVGMSFMLNGQGFALAIGHVGLYTPIIFLLYALALRTVFRYERLHREEFAEEVTERHPDITLRGAGLRYILAATVIVAAGVLLPFVAADLAQSMGWKTSFVGTLLVAATTSLPELVVTIAALRMGALDMAIANLFGSNLFDIAILAFDDILFVRGPLLSYVAPIHAVSAMSAIVMTGVAIVGLLYRPQVRVFKTVGWISLGLFALYVLNSYVLYIQNGSSG